MVCSIMEQLDILLAYLEKVELLFWKFKSDWYELECIGKLQKSLRGVAIKLSLSHTASFSGIFLSLNFKGVLWTQ